MGDFEACRFDFRIDNKTGLTPSKRKKSERRNLNYNTLFKCKICGSLFESRPSLLEHKLEHNVLKCPVCNIKFPKRSMLREHVSIAHGEHCAKSETIAKMLAHASRKKEELKDKDEESQHSPIPFFKDSGFENSLPLPQTLENNTGPHETQTVLPFPPQLPMSAPTSVVPIEQPMLSPLSNAQPQQIMPPMLPMSSPLASPTTCNGVAAPNSQIPGMVYINLPIYIGSQNGQGQGQVPPVFGPSPMQNTMIPLPSMPEETLLKQKEELVKVKTEPVDSIPDTQLPTSMQFYRQEELEPGEIRNNEEYGSRVDSMIPTSVITVAPNSQYSDSFPFSNKPPTDAVAALRMVNAKSPSVRARLNFDRSPPSPAVEDCGALDFSLKSEKRKNEEEALDLTCKQNNKKAKVIEDDRIAMLQEYKADNSSSPEASELGLALSSHGSCNSSRSHTPESFGGQPKRKGRAGGLNNLVAKLWQTKTTKPVGPRRSRKPNPSPTMSSEEVLDQRVGHFNPSSGVDLAPTRLEEDFYSTSQLGSPVPHSGLDFTSKLPRLGGQSNICVEENTSEQLSEEALHMKMPLALGDENNTTNGQEVCKQSPKKGNDYCTIKFHTCRVCKQLFDSAEKMWEHAVTHEDFHKYRCSLCKYVTACKSDLVQHKLNEHGVSNAVRNFVDYSKEFKNSPTTDDNGYNVGGSTFRFSMKDLNGSTPKGRLVCDYPGCGKTFKEWRHLKVHGTLHTGEKPLTCSLCDYACRHRSSMNWHMKSRHGLEKMKTQGNRTVYVDGKGKVVCGSTEELKIEMYTSSKLPGSPLKKHTIDSLILPDNCVNTSEITAMQNAYNEQIGNSDQPNTAFVMPTAPEDDSGNDDSNPMGITNIKSEANEEFRDHDDQGSEISSQSKETPAEEPQFYTSVMKLKYMGLPGGAGEENKHQICPICKQFFESAEKMWEHRMKEHEDQTKIFCETCGWDADSKEELESHMLSTHGKEIGEFKDFICTICGKGYSSKTGLNHHMLRHSEEGPPQFTCPYRGCVSKLHSKGALKNHIRRVHLKVAPKFACPQLGCSRRFDSVSALRGHQVLHSDERPLMCDYPGCDKSFRESKHLKVHRMQHTDERPLRCELCDYSCRQRNSMNWHMKSKHQMEKQVTPDGRTIYYPC